jgi:hypothetical protein
MNAPAFVPRLDAPAVARFVALLRHPAGAAELDAAAWDGIVRVGRATRLLAVLGARLDALGPAAGDTAISTPGGTARDSWGGLANVPPRVRAHFVAEATVARHRAAITAYELHELHRALDPLGVDAIALKGAAYALQDLPMAHGRLFADVDILVRHRDLDRVEGALRAAGWAMAPLHPHDVRYYREWAHELPPIVFPGRGVEVDVHHALLPRTSRLGADPDALFTHAVRVGDLPWRALAPEDQVLHAAAQLFHDADLASRLRDLVDLDGLLRTFARRAGFWPSLAAHAAHHGLARPLWYALRYVPAYLGTPVPPDIAATLVPAPPRAHVAAMDALVSRAVLPADPDAGPTRAQRLARAALFARSHWLRMPPLLLAAHLTRKWLRRARQAREVA